MNNIRLEKTEKYMCTSKIRVEAIVKTIEGFNPYSPGFSIYLI